jgi:cytochrome c peroxidase
LPAPPEADPLKLSLGESLYFDTRLSRDGTLACDSCHDVRTNGAGSPSQFKDRDGSKMPFKILSVFNASLNFRLNWEGNYRDLQSQTESSFENPANLATSVGEILGKLRSDPGITRRFRDAYGRLPDRANLLDALEVFERSLVTPGSRFDRWLKGETTALTPAEIDGYHLFKSLGCSSCHQGANVGGNLFEHAGIFRPLTQGPALLLRVPSLRNVATRPPYFHDGSAATLDEAVRRMAGAQLDQTLSDQEVGAIVAFLGTLTGTYRGAPVVERVP